MSLGQVAAHRSFILAAAAAAVIPSCAFALESVSDVVRSRGIALGVLRSQRVVSLLLLLRYYCYHYESASAEPLSERRPAFSLKAVGA